MISRFVDKTGNKLNINDVVEFKGQTFLITDEETLKSLDHTNDIEIIHLKKSQLMMNT